MEGVYVLHALGASGPVAVVEVEAFALQDEGAYAILDGMLALVKFRLVEASKLTRLVVTLRKPCNGIVNCPARSKIG